MIELTDKQKELRAHFEADLFEFAKYLNPNYCYGEIHETVFQWLQDESPDLNQLLLLPRAHLKSHCIAVWVCWIITKKPWTSIVYVSANEELAKVQVYAIKSMLTSDRYRKLWPEMLEQAESKREKWTENEISVDHPKRKEMGTRDYTLILKTIKSSNTGLHCEHLVFDDIVTDTNAYTEVGRKEVKNGVASFIGVKNPGATTKSVGTRYHPDDVYQAFIDGKRPLLNDEGEIIGEEDQWQVAHAVVEDSGRGNGIFLWPRVRSSTTGQWYGFDPRTLAVKKAEYGALGRSAQFWAQFYNEPNDPGNDRVKEGMNYYNPTKLKKQGHSWYYDGKKLNIYAGMDIAFSDDTGASKSDYTAIAVVGIDAEGFIFILDLIQYRTTTYSVHYDHIIKLYDKWHWKKIKIETNNAGKLVDKEIKKLLRKNGRTMLIQSSAKTKHDGTKLERYSLILEPRYQSGYVLHYKGGYIDEYEDQLRKTRPRFDDLKDAVTDAMEIMEIPSDLSLDFNRDSQPEVCVADAKYGGKRFRRQA